MTLGASSGCSFVSLGILAMTSCFPPSSQKGLSLFCILFSCADSAVMYADVFQPVALIYMRPICLSFG